MNFIPWDDITKIVDSILVSSFADKIVKNVAYVLILIGVPPTHTPGKNNNSINYNHSN